MDKKILLLNSTYEALSFISEQRLYKFLYKDMVEVVSTWDQDLIWGKDKINFPAIIRLKHLVKRKSFRISFSRYAVLKRDNQICQYCGKHLKISESTIDHVLPKKLGGESSFTNCVLSCFPCNNKKSSQTLEESKMALIKAPTYPTFKAYFKEPNILWHEDWKLYLN